MDGRHKNEGGYEKQKTETHSVQGELVTLNEQPTSSLELKDADPVWGRDKPPQGVVPDKNC